LVVDTMLSFKPLSKGTHTVKLRGREEEDGGRVFQTKYTLTSV